MRHSIITTLACLAASFVSVAAHADTFLNITTTPQHNIFASGSNLLSNTSPISTGGSVWSSNDGFFAENGDWYQINSANAWTSYTSALDVVLGANTGSGGSAWFFSDGFFAADDNFYVIDSNNIWHQFGSGTDLLSNTNQLASGASAWGFDGGYFAADGEYYVIDGNNTWHEYATASDLLSNTNLVASGGSAFAFLDGFAADSAAVPEPTSLAALSVAAIGAIGVRRRRKA